MTDEFDRRLRGLVDDIEPAVRISPASETRERGRRRRLRQRATAGVAAAAAVGAIATSFVALSGGDTRTGRAASPSSGTSTASPGSPGVCPLGNVEVKPGTATPGPTAPPGQETTVTALDAYHRMAAELGIPVCGIEAGGTRGPLSPKALRVEDLPSAPEGWMQHEMTPGTWAVDVRETSVAPGVFCLPSTWGTGPTGASGDSVGAPPATKLLVTSYDARPKADPVGNAIETVATFATEAEAQAAEAKLAAAAASCQGRYPTAELTQLGTANAPMWKWDHAPGSYRGYEGYIRSGNTILTIGYLQGGPFAVEFTPQILQTAIDRATS